MLENFELGSGDLVKVVCVVDMAVPLSIDIHGGYLPETTAIEAAAREHAANVAAEIGNFLKMSLDAVGRRTPYGSSSLPTDDRTLWNASVPR